MDESVRLPGGYRIGWDGIIGLIPGVGDFAGLLISLYIVNSARSAGASIATLARMLLNVALEAVIGIIPIVGDVFDFMFKANTRNMSLLKRHLTTPTDVETESQRTITFIAIAVVALIATIAFFVVKTSQWIFALFL